jgi:hypothetical protein
MRFACAADHKFGSSWGWRALLKIATNLTLHSVLAPLKAQVFPIRKMNAGVVKLVDALDSKSCSERSVGSSPTAGTIFWGISASLRAGKTEQSPLLRGLWVG